MAVTVLRARSMRETLSPAKSVMQAKVKASLQALTASWGPVPEAGGNAAATQLPARHTSSPLHALPSLQTAPSDGACWQPRAGSQVSYVQGLPSSQSRSARQGCCTELVAVTAIGLDVCAAVVGAAVSVVGD